MGLSLLFPVSRLYINGASRNFRRQESSPYKRHNIFQEDFAWNIIC